MNPSTALFKNDELVAWCVMADSGEMSNMVVRDEYKRNHFGTNATIRQVKKIHKMGRIPFGLVDFWNEKSFKMLSRIKCEWIDNCSCIGVKKLPWQDNPHRNWYQI